VVNPMPQEHKERIRDRVMALRFAPWRPSLEEIARAVEPWWPGVTADQIRGVVAGLASKEAAIRRAMREKRPALESG
jgi:hypothetical protein